MNALLTTSFSMVLHQWIMASLWVRTKQWHYPYPARTFICNNNFQFYSANEPKKTAEHFVRLMTSGCSFSVDVVSRTNLVSFIIQQKWIDRVEAWNILKLISTINRIRSGIEIEIDIDILWDMPHWLNLLNLSYLWTNCHPNAILNS